MVWPLGVGWYTMYHTHIPKGDNYTLDYIYSRFLLCLMVLIISDYRMTDGYVLPFA